MTPFDEQFESSLLALPLEERARLADKLIESLDHEQDPALEEAWGQEISDRIKAREEGNIAVRDGNAVLEKLWKSLEQ